MSLKWIISFATFLVLAVLVSPARADDFGDILVTAEPPAHAQRTHGYTEYRVSLMNVSVRATHQVTLTLPQESYYGGTVTRTFTVEPGSTINASLFTSVALTGHGLGVSIDGQQRDSVAIDMAGLAYDLRRNILVSQGADKAFQNRSDTATNNLYVAKSPIPAQEWSTSWLGYSSYDGVVLTAGEMRVMPEPVASALMRYVECGGSLIIIGSWDVPQTWRAEKEQDGLLATYYAGFGVCMVSDNAAMDSLSDSQWQHIGKTWDQSQSPWSHRGGVFEFSTANNDFPVMENVSIPVRGLLLIMLAFVILIGPVNLFILSKKKKKMWLLWTVPAISLVTCLAVSAYSIFSEGWGGRARYLSFTILDERSHRASTIGLNAFYSPLTPGDGLRYSTETEVTSQAGSPGYSYSTESLQFRTADWTDDQHLESGWVSARAPAHFMIRRSETRRERLTVTRGADGRLSVVNGLGVPIRTLWLADEKGVIHNGSSIAAGASTTLEVKKEANVVARFGDLRGRFAGDWVAAVKRGATHLDLTRPRTYIAELEGCPFLEDGLKGVKQKKQETLVYGIMKGPGDEN